MIIIYLLYSAMILKKAVVCVINYLIKKTNECFNKTYQDKTFNGEAL